VICCRGVKVSASLPRSPVARRRHQGEPDQESVNGHGERMPLPIEDTIRSPLKPNDAKTHVMMIAAAATTVRHGCCRGCVTIPRESG